MNADAAREASETEQADAGLDHPHAVDILTTEHWSLLSTRSVGYDEMFGRTTIFVSILSGFVIAMALLAQATRFGRETLWIALLLIAVALFVGLTTFARCVAINLEDARCQAGMNLLRQAYFRLVPGLRPYFLTTDMRGRTPRPLGHGAPQRFSNLTKSLTTTSSVVAALNSALAGSLIGDACVLLSWRPLIVAVSGAAVSIASAALHLSYAARFRERHPSTETAR